jgi:glutamate/tyrosine decarboxylase-like PLP-dependent enzyme
VETPDWAAPLSEAYDAALAYLTGLPDRPVRSAATPAELRLTLGGPLPLTPTDPRKVVAELASAAEPGVMPSSSGRFFGFVVGGCTPVALAADWLTATWDQNAGLSVLGPAAAVVEEVAGAWLAELFGLPAGVSVGFVTGAQAANFTALAAARHEVLRRVGWDVEVDGLAGAPPIRVLAGASRHDTIDRALRFLGFGTAAITPVEADTEGRLVASALRDAVRGIDGPVVVCAQVGNVNTGAMDPVGEICEIAHAAGAWVHVDGAFGLWAAASPVLRPRVAGVERADSWATDAHKWLNVPYDSGVVLCAHPDAHRAAMGVRASYLIHSADRDPLDYGPDFSRRARGFPIYAAIRALGRRGIADLVDSRCALARRFAQRLTGAADILTEVVLNQVLVRFRAADGDHDRHTHEVIRRIQDDGACWMSGTTWRGRAAMRISVTNWSTDESDVDSAVATILRCADEVQRGG